MLYCAECHGDLLFICTFPSLSKIFLTWYTSIGTKFIHIPQANLARWEPWHGKFGFFHPWEKYLEVGETLGELAAMIFTFYGYLQSSKKVCYTQVFF